MSEALILLLAFAAPGLDEPTRHQGTWSVVSQVRDGQEGPPDVVASIRRIVEGDHITWTRDGKSFAGTKVTYDPSQTPHALDLIPDGGPNRDRHVLGIYKLDGDDLTICVADAGEPRPTAFEAAAGSKRTLQKFKRTKAPEPGNAEDRKLVDRAKLQGSWSLLSMVNRGDPVRPRAPRKWQFAGDRLSQGTQGSNSWARIEIDPTQSPPAMDMIPDSGPSKDKRALGIYRLEDDRLTICFGLPDEPRPVAFESKAGGKQTLLNFRRADP